MRPKTHKTSRPGRPGLPCESFLGSRSCRQRMDLGEGIVGTGTGCFRLLAGRASYVAGAASGHNPTNHGMIMEAVVCGLCPQHRRHPGAVLGET